MKRRYVYTDPHIVGKLDQVTAALGLVHGELARIGTPREANVLGIRTDQPAGSLARQLWVRLGQRRVRVLMTKLGNIDRAVRSKARSERQATNGAKPMASVISWPAQAAGDD